MENLYRLDEYSSSLPNPKHFPIQGAVIIGIKDRPNMFGDGFFLDLSVKGADKQRLEEKAGKAVSMSSINDILDGAKKSRVLLSEPEFIYDTTYFTYILFTPNGNPVAIQVKYYKYFRNRYPECKFYKRNEDSMLITIKLDKEVVGLCMPMFLEQRSIAKIKEERK